MIEVCFSHSYTQKKTADLAGSAVFLFENLLQASRLVIHPRFHTADVIGLYGTVADMTAAVILHSSQTFLKIVILRAVVGMPIEQNGTAAHVFPAENGIMA